MKLEEFIEQVREAWTAGRHLAGSAAHVELNGCGEKPVRARLEGGWLHLAAAPKQGNGAMVEPLELLRLNSLLRGHARFWRRTPGGAAAIRAEIPIDAESGVEPHIRETVAGMGDALRVLEGGELLWTAGREEEHCSAQGFGEEEAERIARLCRDAGWEARARTSGAVTVELKGGRGSLHQASIFPAGLEGAVCVVELVSLAGLGEDSQRAIPTLLLSASGAMRLVRPAVVPAPEGMAARLEVAFATSPPERELEHALCALQVAAGLCCHEARALAHEETARRYLRFLAAGPESKAERP